MEDKDREIERQTEADKDYRKKRNCKTDDIRNNPKIITQSLDGYHTLSRGPKL